MVGQYRDGIYHISAWSHITNAHLVKIFRYCCTQERAHKLTN